MQTLCCTSANFLVLNADLLKLPNASAQSILSSFTLKEPRTDQPRPRTSITAIDFLAYKNYDLFYSAEKKERFQKLVQNLSREQLKEYLKYIFTTKYGTKVNKGIDLLESVYEFFSDDVIKRTYLKIGNDIDIKQTQTREDSRVRIQLQSDQKLMKRIAKLKPEQKSTVKSISNRLNRPYHQVRFLLKTGKTTQQNIISERSKTERKAKRMKAIKKFGVNFRRYQEGNMTINQMFEDMKIGDEYCREISRSHFYKYFIRQQGFVHVKPKLKHSMFQVERKNESRHLTTFLIFKIIQTNQFLIFYDETTIQMTKSGYASWFHRTDEKERQIRVTNTFLKLNLITSMTRLISFCITFDSFNACNVAHLVNRTCVHLSENEARGREIFIVMDNAPKNRSNMLLNFCEDGPYRIVMTTPTTPQHNFAKSIFFFVKKRIDRLNFCSAEGKQKESKDVMVKQIFEVLRGMDGETFANARKMYLKDLQSTLH